MTAQVAVAILTLLHIHNEQLIGEVVGMVGTCTRENEERDELNLHCV